MPLVDVTQAQHWLIGNCFDNSHISRTAEKLLSDLNRLLFDGTYPPLYDRTLDPHRWYGNYVRTYLERDVRQLINVHDLGNFQRFLRLCAARTGQLLNLSSLATDCGIRDLEKIKLRALLVYGSVFGVAPKVTYNEYAPLGAP